MQAVAAAWLPPPGLLDSLPEVPHSGGISIGDGTMKFQMFRGANVPRLLAAASAFLLAAACRDLPTATPVDALKQPATPARDLLTLDPLCGVGILGADGTLGSGAQWLVCKPPLWNGSVIVWAHGYVDPTNPLRLPDDVIEGARIRDIALGLG